MERPSKNISEEATADILSRFERQVRGAFAAEARTSFKRIFIINYPDLQERIEEAFAKLERELLVPALVRSSSRSVTGALATNGGKE